MQAEVKEASDNFNKIYYSSFFATCTVGQIGIIDCNSALLEMMGGASRDELIGLHPGDFFAGSAARRPEFL